MLDYWSANARSHTWEFDEADPSLAYAIGFVALLMAVTLILLCICFRSEMRFSKKMTKKIMMPVQKEISAYNLRFERQGTTIMIHPGHLVFRCSVFLRCGGFVGGHRRCAASSKGTDGVAASSAARP